MDLGVVRLDPHCSGVWLLSGIEKLLFEFVFPLWHAEVMCWHVGQFIVLDGLRSQLRHWSFNKSPSKPVLESGLLPLFRLIHLHLMIYLCLSCIDGNRSSKHRVDLVLLLKREIRWFL